MVNKTGRCDGTCDDCECPPAKDIPPAMAEQFKRAVAGPQPAKHQTCQLAQVGNSTAQPVPEYKERCPHGLRWENAHRCRVCSAPPAQEPAK